ncbi:MAG: hypothetical protein JWQ48_1356 [Conexibacter sp.]|nr:hypothetical protein [Conexibacter sp.]
MAVDYAQNTHPLHHVGLTVSDIGASVAFYAKLGFTPDEPEIVEVRGPWIQAVTGYEDAHLLITVIALGDVALELLQYLAPTGSSRATVATRDAGSAHIAVRVEDIDAEVERLRGEGVEFVSEPQTIPPGNKSLSGARVVYLIDPDGNTAELCQGAPVS